MLHVPSPFNLLSRLLRPRTPEDATPPDPVDHPAVRRMGPRELADLPLPRPAARPWCPSREERG